MDSPIAYLNASIDIVGITNNLTGTSSLENVNL